MPVIPHSPLQDKLDDNSIISKNLIDLFLENQNDKKTSCINISITDLRQNQTKNTKQNNMKHDLSFYRFAFQGKGQWDPHLPISIMFLAQALIPI